MIGTTLLERYRLEAEIGRGGMGVVYRAQDTLLERAVAVKVLNPTGLGTAGRARLLTEAQAAAQLNHPNIVMVFDVGFAAETDGQPFIIMELVEGGSLRGCTPATLGETLALARQVAGALQHAHAHGIIHRDLKLENVLLTPERVAKLTDFGLARTTRGPRLTQAGQIFGTVTYLAPELIQGASATALSDLYAFGVMVYELLTGRPPFEADDFITLLAQHLHAPVVPPSTHAPAVPAWLDDLVVALLHKQPAARPESAEAVGRLLDQNAERPTAALAAPAAPPTNLTPPLTRFVGRARELQRLQRLLQPAAADGQDGAPRLITLTGSGGVGKTRLAQHAALNLLTHFPNGIWLVELAPLTDPERVPQAVAAALGVREERDRPLFTALTDYLREKQVLLLLDNCEHLIDACAQLAEQLLRACPHLQLLATSREALGIEGEAAVRVPSLSLPGPAGAPPDDSEAVQLFVDRAAAALPGFALTAENAGPITQICRRLDGIALAIELAAARVKLLSVDQIAARLDDAFRLLTGGSRTALPRQQTLRATMDWSHQLLADAERVLLRRLAVFMGGWTLEAAEAVATDPPAGPGPAPLCKDDVLDLLTQLVNKSLVVVERERGPEARYQLLETIRQYAREKLREAGEAEVRAVRDRHLAYHLALAEQAEREFASPRQMFWLGRLDDEAGNLRLAFEWALDQDVTAALRLASALWIFWTVTADWGRGRAWLTTALAQAQTVAPAIRAPALARAAAVTLGQGDVRAAEALLAESEALARASGDNATLALTLVLQADAISWARSEYARAEALAQESLALFQALGPDYRWGQAQALEHLAYAAGSRNDNDLAVARCEASLALRRAMGDSIGVAEALSVLAMYALGRGDRDRSLALVEESLALKRKLADKRGLATLLQRLGFWFQTDYARARPWLEEALALSRDLGHRLGLTYALRNLALIELLHGDLDRTARLLEECLPLARQEANQLSLAYTLADVGRVAYHRGDLPRAAELLQESVALARDIGNLAWSAYPLSRLGFVAAAQGQTALAQASFHESLQLYRQWQQPWGIAECLSGLADLAAADDPERAARLLAVAAGIRHLVNAPTPPVEQAAEVNRVAAVRARLGEAAFTAAWNAVRVDSEAALTAAVAALLA